MNSLSKRLLTLSLIGFVAVTGCSSMSSVCQGFFSRSTSEREKIFRAYDLEKQLEIYHCGLKRRPPDSSLALLIAERGEASIPALLQYLETEKDELFQYGLIDVFRVMSVKGFFRNKANAIERIRQVVGKMKIAAFKELAQKDLTEIEKNSF